MDGGTLNILSQMNPSNITLRRVTLILKLDAQPLSADVFLLARQMSEKGRLFIEPFCVIVTFVDNMTAIYTEDIMRALNKTQLIELFLKSQEHTKGIINSLNEEMENLNENFKKNQARRCYRQKC